MSQYRALSMQRQTSAEHSPAGMAAPAGTSPGPSSASVLMVSLESTAKQVGLFQVGPTEPGLLGHVREARRHPLAGQATQGKKTPKALVAWREEGNWAGGPSEPLLPTGVPYPPPGHCSLPPPIPSSRCPLLPPPESLPAARANPLGVLQRWTPVPPAPASTEAGVRTVVGSTCACVQRASLATTARQVGSQAYLLTEGPSLALWSPSPSSTSGNACSVHSSTSTLTGSAVLGQAKFAAPEPCTHRPFCGEPFPLLAYGLSLNQAFPGTGAGTESSLFVLIAPSAGAFSSLSGMASVPA